MAEDPRWTPERIEILTTMWRDGHSGRDIALRLGIKNKDGEPGRSSVIGKIHRLGLSHRAEVIKKRAARPRHLKKKANDNAPPKRRDIVAQTFALPPDHADDVIRVRDIADLEIHHCKWPIGTPGDAAFGFCGAGRVPGLPYCNHHIIRGYVLPEPKRQRMAPEFVKNQNTLVKEDA